MRPNYAFERTGELAALVPTPRVNLPRYHGVFAPNHRGKNK